MMFLFAWVMAILTVVAWWNDRDWHLCAFYAVFSMLASIFFEVHRK